MRQNSEDKQAAKATALRLFKKYGYGSNELGNYEVSNLLNETYSHLNICIPIWNIEFKSTSKDVKEFTHMLGGGLGDKLTLEDLEKTCIRYLCEDPIEVIEQSSHLSSNNGYNYT